MADAFDPHHAWLGIPPDEQPPNCYRLLGIAPFEANLDAIQNAADQRMVYLKSLAMGQHAAQAQRLLNHVAAARVRLLDPYKKEMYDRQLREELAQHAALALALAANALAANAPAANSPAAAANAGAAREDAAREDAARADAQTATFAAIGQLGEYQLLEKLGEGGMGAVYKALHTRLKRVVALKLLPKDRLRDEHAIARFEREMAAVGAVDHPNIVRAMDAREIEGTRFLVMEYVEGLDLNAMGKLCHPLAAADVCEIVRQAALGLEDIHRRGLVHRDIKPSNLMVTPQGVVKLLDLGLARFQAESQVQEEVTGTGTAMGTVDYMAPEQIADARTVDIRADIYSLGCTLYKLLSGRTPFSGDRYRTAGEKMAAHLRDAPPPIAQHCPGLPQPLASLVMRMLAKDPAERPSRPLEVADAVGPLATTANLAALAARAMGHSGEALEGFAQPGGDAQAAKETHSSSTMTRFFRDLVSAGPRHRGAAAAHPSTAATRKSTAVVAGLALAAGLLLIGGVWATYHFTRPGRPTLVFDVPDEHRPGLVVWVDDAQARIPEDGPIELAYPPGEHRVWAVRPGYRMPEQKVRLVPGQQATIAPTWQRQPNVMLPWPAADRQFARLEVDGAPQDLDALAARSTMVGTIQLTLEPGTHRLTLDRLNYEPIERSIEVVEGPQQTLELQWRPQGTLAAKEAALAAKPEPPPAVAAKPDPAKPGAGPGPGPDPSKPDGPAKQDVKELASKEKPAAASAADDPAVLAAKELAKARERRAARAARSARAAQWTKQTAASEALVAAWDFAAAKAALAKVAFVEAELTERLRQRRDALDRMASLKQKLIARIDAAQPRLNKSDLQLRGIGGEVTKADDSGITSRLINGRDETRPWSDVGEKAVAKLLQLAVDANRADDWVAAGVAALALGHPSLAERLLDKARSLGANIDTYLAPLAEASFGRVEELLKAKKYLDAETALASLELKHAGLPWFAANKPSIEASREAAKTGIREAEAEDLFTQAADSMKNRDLFELKALLSKLKTDYPETAPVTDTRRKPSLVDMEMALASVAKLIAVRMDGKGDYTRIQEAIDKAPPNSIIEIQDFGPYNESVEIPREKEKLTLRGKKGCLPVITLFGSRKDSGTLLAVGAAATTLERLVLAYPSNSVDTPQCLTLAGVDGFRMRSMILYSPAGRFNMAYVSKYQWENCLAISPGITQGTGEFKNCLFLGANSRLCFDTSVYIAWVGEMRSCTLLGTIGVPHSFNILDSIVGELQEGDVGNRYENCAVMKRPPPSRSKSCLQLNPMFRDPANLDFRLAPGSPCIGKASDGGDIGCRYTPEMIELCKQALELRRRGVIKF